MSRLNYGKPPSLYVVAVGGDTISPLCSAGWPSTLKAGKEVPHRIKPLSVFLGMLMFVFGFLKFFQPIRGWFDVQIEQSHLPPQAVPVGKVSEIMTGVLFLLPWLRRSLPERSRHQILLVACLILFTQMIVAIYVHLQPGVPARVLPLGIKPPVIPIVVLLLGVLAAFDVSKELRAQEA